MLGFVAVGALSEGMSSLKAETGEIVVEGVLVEFYDLEVNTVVVVMAGHAFLSLYFRRDMITFVRIDPCLQFGMACQAFGIGDLVSQFMALGAVRKSLEVGMYC